jgi:hypothetical protein
MFTGAVVPVTWCAPDRLLFSIYFPNKNDACNFDAVKALVEETTPAPEMTCDLNYFALKS